MSEFVSKLLSAFIAVVTLTALYAYSDSRTKEQAAPLCAAHAAYPVGVSGRLVICEGADSTGARVWTVVEVADE